MCYESHHGSNIFADAFHISPHEIAKMKKMAKHFMRGFLGSQIPYNIEDLGDSYLITVPLAGRSKEDVKVSLLNKHLNIKAEKPKIPEGEKMKDKPEKKNSPQDCCVPLFSRGFTFIEVNMDIPLPVDADTETLVSKMANGLLKITIGKKPAKKIDISEN